MNDFNFGLLAFNSYNFRFPLRKAKRGSTKRQRECGFFFFLLSFSSAQSPRECGRRRKQQQQHPKQNTTHCIFLFFSLVTTHTCGSRTACTLHTSWTFLERENRNPPFSLHSLSIIFLSLRNQSQNKDPLTSFLHFLPLFLHNIEERETHTHENIVNRILVWARTFSSLIFLLLLCAFSLSLSFSLCFKILFPISLFFKTLLFSSQSCNSTPPCVCCLSFSLFCDSVSVMGG